MTHTITKYFNDFLSIIYPHNCAACGNDVLGKSHLLCWTCLKSLPLTGFETQSNNLVSQLFAGRIPVEMATAFLFFSKDSKVQHLIHLVKYKSQKELGHYLGTLMGHAIQQANWNEIDLIIPVPLNKKKAAKRGFNQAKILADGISEVLQKPVAEVAIVRSKFTETQTRKNRISRWQNVEDVFELGDFAGLENKRVLLIDDVVTTGATLEACGQILLKIPGLKLNIGALAFASKL
jgi:ComF family protein